MNAVEIEEAISELAEQPFDAAEFPLRARQQKAHDAFVQYDPANTDGVNGYTLPYVAPAPPTALADEIDAIRTTSRAGRGDLGSSRLIVVVLAAHADLTADPARVAASFRALAESSLSAGANAPISREVQIALLSLERPDGAADIVNGTYVQYRQMLLDESQPPSSSSSSTLPLYFRTITVADVQTNAADIKNTIAHDLIRELCPRSPVATDEDDARSKLL